MHRKWLGLAVVGSFFALSIASAFIHDPFAESQSLSSAEIDGIRTTLRAIDNASDESGIRRLLYGMYLIGAARLSTNSLPVSVGRDDLRKIVGILAQPSSTLDSLLAQIEAITLTTALDRRITGPNILVRFQTTGNQPVQLVNAKAADFDFKLYVKTGSTLSLHRPANDLITASVQERGTVSGLARMSGLSDADVDLIPREIRENIHVHLAQLARAPLFPLFAAGKDFRVAVTRVRGGVTENHELAFANSVFLPGYKVQIDGVESTAPMIGTLTKSVGIGGVKVKFAH